MLDYLVYISPVKNTAFVALAFTGSAMTKTYTATGLTRG